jgi:hypothetical protein
VALSLLSLCVCVWRGLYRTSSALLLLLVLSVVLLPASLESWGWLGVGVGRGPLSWVRAEHAAVSSDAILLHWPSESNATAGSSLSSLRGPLACPAPCTGGGRGTDERRRLFLGGRLTLSSPTLTQSKTSTERHVSTGERKGKRREERGAVVLRVVGVCVVLVPGAEEGTGDFPLHLRGGQAVGGGRGLLLGGRHGGVGVGVVPEGRGAGHV